MLLLYYQKIKKRWLFMYLVYNKIDTVVNKFRDYFSNFCNSKTLLNFLPEFFCSLIDAESTTTSKISLSLFNSINDSINLDSHSKRIYRFLHNSKYNIHSLFDAIVIDVLSRFKLSHSDRNIHISFDHMYDKCNFTVLMFTLRIGKQGVPIYFEVFKGSDKEGHGDAFKNKNIKKGILYCHKLIKSVIPDAHIIFLADRWFGNLFPLMQYIDSLGDIFVFRCKQNLKVFYQKYPENHKIWIPITELPHLVHASKLYTNLEFTRKKYVFNLAYCKSKDHKEAWLLITNGNPKVAKAHYGYRFGSIEFLFKSQKTNGFYLEECGIKKIHAFRNLYALICIANIYLTCLGTDVSKNSRCYKNIGIVITRKNSKTNNRYRVISRFRTGLILFKMAINCKRRFRLPITFTLYDT